MSARRVAVADMESPVGPPPRSFHVCQSPGMSGASLGSRVTADCLHPSGPLPRSNLKWDLQPESPCSNQTPQHRGLWPRVRPGLRRCGGGRTSSIWLGGRDFFKNRSMDGPPPGSHREAEHHVVSHPHPLKRWQERGGSAWGKGPRSHARMAASNRSVCTGKTSPCVRSTTTLHFDKSCYSVTRFCM